MKTCGEYCANYGCHGGHGCAAHQSYKQNFDHLGNMTKGDYHPWTKADIAIVVLLFITILLLGVV